MSSIRERAERAQARADWPSGCGDNSCVVCRSGGGGMATNGGCQCTERTLRRAFLAARRDLDPLADFALRVTGSEMRERILTILRRDCCDHGTPRDFHDYHHLDADQIMALICEGQP